MRRALSLALAFVCVGAGGTYLYGRAKDANRHAGTSADGRGITDGVNPEVAAEHGVGGEDHEKRATPAPLGPDESSDLRFQVPSGGVTRITCREARRVIAEVRTELAYDPEPVSPKDLSASASDWLDPHSFWSLPEDAPVASALDAAAHDLILEVEGHGGSECSAARRVGAVLAAWSQKLRASFEAGTHDAKDVQSPESRELASGGRTEERAFDLGRRARAFRSAAGDAAEPYFAASRDRFFPDMTAEEWGEVVLAAVVRAYVPLIDPHGAWAPLDEKSSVYEVDLFAAPPEKPWGKVTVTAVGFRIDDHAVAPLLDLDVVLEVNGLATVGMPLEQVEQLGFAARQEGPAKVTVVRGGAITKLTVGARPDGPHVAASAAPESHLEVTHIPYGDESVAVIAFQDVRDDLGDDVRDVITDLMTARTAGIVLDLRGNGGGSTDGAINALGHFIPNATLFPTRRRDGTIEIDHSPADTPTWEGPVATLVDGSTASAAEMIAGALMAYGRGPSVGAKTFGKGCAQEYLDDEASVGVLRLTTLLYALPDGSPVQRVGLTPTIVLPFVAKNDDPHEREALLPHTAPTWRGPDRRSPLAMVKKDSWTWPPRSEKIGPCDDEDVCRALSALGAHGPDSPSARRPQIAKNRADQH